MIKKILKTFENPLVYALIMILVVMGSLTYWTYLYFNTEMIIIFDAEGYEKLGRLIYEKGWAEYFRGGPEREPFYPGTIAASMYLGEMFQINYQHFQKIFQIIFLFLTQLLLLYVLERLKIHSLIKVLTVLYFGVSPSIVNAGFSLFSEIIAFPFVLLALIFAAKSWQALYGTDTVQCMKLSCLSAIFFFLLSLGKGAFQYVFYVTLLPFISVFARSLWQKNWTTLRNALSYLVIVVIMFSAGINSVKFLNKKYNGHFTFSGKYNFVVLGSAIKKTRPITKDIFLAYAASVPGMGVCKWFFSDEQCNYVDWFGSIDTTSEERAKLLEGFDNKEKNEAMIKIAVLKVTEHPFRFSLFSFLEAIKMFFWETTRVGFVHYPDWLNDIFVNKVIRYGLRFGVCLLTLVSLLFLLTDNFRRRSQLFDPKEDAEASRLCFLTLLIVFTYAGIYGSCYILTRYSLPIAALFLVAIAYFFNYLVRGEQNET